MRTTLRRLVIATVVSYLLCGLIGLGAFFLGNSLRVGVCNFQADLQQRIEASQEYLHDHPNGAPKLGVTRAQIEETIQNEERTRDSLSSSIRC